MKYNCENEFDLQIIYKKLTSGHSTPTVAAKNFFTRDDELELLQKKMNRLMSIVMKKVKIRNMR